MMLGPHIITVVRAPLVPGDYGTGTAWDWEQATSTLVAGCSVQPAPAPEFTTDRDSTAVRWVIWLPPEADVESTDRIEWNGHSYDVDGEVLEWDFPPLSHQVVNLYRSEESP